MECALQVQLLKTIGYEVAVSRCVTSWKLAGFMGRGRKQTQFDSRGVNLSKVKYHERERVKWNDSKYVLYSKSKKSKMKRDKK